MYTLNLSSFRPLPQLKSISYSLKFFSGGEPHIVVDPHFDIQQEVTITIQCSSFDDIGKILVANDALKRLGVKKINLFIPYFPGARQDRINLKGEALTAKVYADLINAQQFNRVFLLDPHSEFTPQSLHRVALANNSQFYSEIQSHLKKNFYMVAPDKGALHRTQEIANSLPNLGLIQCNKQRDLTTGEIISYSVEAEDLQGANCLITDDICDGGRTFIATYKALKEKNAGQVYLAVTHGIFSHGIETLTQNFNAVFCTDSFRTISNQNKFIQIPLHKTIQL